MDLFLFIVVNVFAGFFQGVVGLGHGLIATPLSLVFLSKGTTFTAVVVAGSILNPYVAKQIKEPLNTRIFWPLLSGCVLGMPFGLIILKFIPKNDLLVVVGSMSIILMPLILFAKIRVQNMRLWTPIVGFICGVLQTSTSMAGPPVALLLSGSDVSKHSMRKILVTFFFAISVISIPFFFLGGILTPQGFLYGLCVAPFILVAGHVGNKAANHIPHHWYKRLALSTIFVTGAFAIYSGLR